VPTNAFVPMIGLAVGEKSSDDPCVGRAGHAIRCQADASDLTNSIIDSGLAADA
tara:strand:+ start:2030 stop:2191 length:162 start_codon:yes stop_codon:yes gene_type:complete